jgi:hypothetical protein
MQPHTSPLCSDNIRLRSGIGWSNWPLDGAAVQDVVPHPSDLLHQVAVKDQIAQAGNILIGAEGKGRGIDSVQRGFISAL